MSAITLTFGCQAENGVGMQKLGSLSKHGWSVAELEALAAQWDGTELVHLGDAAAVLVLRRGVEALGVEPDELESCLLGLDWDKKCWMRGRVVNKRARWNLCFAHEAQESNFANKKGTVVSYDDVPLLGGLRGSLETLFIGGSDLQCEGNYYYDAAKCGIGFHGDAERKKVIGLRLGTPIPLVFQWYQKGERVGAMTRIDLHHGDMYIMSEKATGFDWKKRNVKTLRHAAGCEKYIK